MAAREYAKMTRAEAASWLPCSESSIKDYETGARAVPDEIVLEMARTYRTPWLRVQHLLKNEVFRDVFEVDKKHYFSDMQNRPKAVLNMQREVGDVVNAMPKIIEETLDCERLSDKFVKELGEACSSLFVLIGCNAKKETACAATQTVRSIGFRGEK